MRAPGDDIISLLGTARESVMIVAPFIRTEALIRLLDCISADVKITIVTRWRPADLLAGTSDLDIYDATVSKGIKLYLRWDLHAKLFAADDQCLAGSANVTLTALGWRMPANLELLVPVLRSTDHIIQFEEQLFKGTVRATAEQRNRLAELIDRLRDSHVQIPKSEGEESDSLRPGWVPRTRNPEELYSVYQGNSDIGHSIQQVMQEELTQIGVIPGMREDMFREWVSAVISQTPLVEKVIHRIEQKGQVTESDMSVFLTEIGVDTKINRPRDVLETLRRWLTYFLPDHYETAQDSIKLIKVKTL